MKRLVCLLAAGAMALAAEETKPAPKPVGEVTLVGAPASFPLETRPGEPLDAAKVERDVKALWQARRPSDVHVEVSEGDTTRVVFRVEGRHTVVLRKVQIDPPTPGIRPGVEPGQEIDQEAPQRIAIELRKQLESSGFTAAAVDARLAPVADRKADLLIHIDKGRSVDVGAVAFSGDLGVKEGELRGALRATKPTTILPRIPGLWNGWHLLPGYNDDRVPADIANLRSFYYRHGYFAADVTAAPVDFTGPRARVEFDVDSGPHYAIRQFTLAGPDGERQIRGDMAAACRELLAERRKAERTGVLDFGARIEVREVPGPLGEAGKYADLKATIEPGPAYELGRITFRGNHKFSESVLRGSMLLDEGAPLDQMRLRRSLARLNQMGFFEPISERDVVVNTPPGASRADVTIWLKEKKAHNWSFSGPVGPMSVAGPLEFSLGSRLPSWGQGVLDLSTYMISLRLMFFAKPLGTLIPFLPNKRFIPLITISRPLLPGQQFLSGASFAPQLGWQGMLLGYGASQVRTLTRGLFQSDHALTPVLPVTMMNGANQGTMYCAPPKTALDWMRQAGGMLFSVAFSFLPI